MKIGAVFPQIEMPADPIVIRDYAQAVEGMGFDYLLAYDHVLGANPDRPGGWSGPYTYTDPFHEIFVLFGYLAGLTRSIELVTGVVILPQRQTALIAKQAAQIDVLSGGRLRLGIGVGWNAVEYEALNEDFSNRGKRSAEQVDLLRKLWTNDLVNYDGAYHSIPDAGINPLPVRQPIPIWFGGYADAALRRMARLGDGWFSGGTPLEKAKPMIETIHQYLAEYGRSPDKFGLDPWLNARRHERSQWLSLGQQWKSVGATHLAMDTMRCDFKTIAQHLEAQRQFMGEVGELQG